MFLEVVCRVFAYCRAFDSCCATPKSEPSEPEVRARFFAYPIPPPKRSVSDVFPAPFGLGKQTQNRPARVPLTGIAHFGLLHQDPFTPIRGICVVCHQTCEAAHAIAHSEKGSSAGSHEGGSVGNSNLASPMAGIFQVEPPYLTMFSFCPVSCAYDPYMNSVLCSTSCCKKQQRTFRCHVFLGPKA